MLEAEHILGEGSWGAIFSLKGHSNIGVKLLYRENDYSLKKLRHEFKKGKMFRKLGLPVIRYLKMARVKISSPSSHILEKFPHAKDKVYTGLVMELVDHEAHMVDEHTVKALYRENKAKFEKLGITVIDSHHKKNVIYSRRHNQLYFIDFDLWRVPSYAEMKLRKKFSRK